MDRLDHYLRATRDREPLFPGGALDYAFTRGPLRFVVLDVEIEDDWEQAIGVRGEQLARQRPRS